MKSGTLSRLGYLVGARGLWETPSFARAEPQEAGTEAGSKPAHG